MELNVLTILGSLCISLLFGYVNGRHQRHESNKNIYLTLGYISVCKYKWEPDPFEKDIYLLVKLYIEETISYPILAASPTVQVS